MPTLRTCLTAPLERLARVAELPWTLIDQARLPPVSDGTRRALRRAARPGRR